MIILDWRYFCRRYLFDAYEQNKTGVLALYQYDPSAEDKMERNVGARIKFEIVEDEKIIEALNKANDNAIREGSTICHVVEVLPLG